MSEFFGLKQFVRLLAILCLAVGLTNPVQAVYVGHQGTPVAWGGYTLGQTNVPAGLTNVIAISAGYYHNLAVKADGTVIVWGYFPWTAPADLTGVVDVAAGNQHSMALKNNGKVVVWGDGSAGQTNVPAWLNGVKAIAAGQNHCMALTSNGVVVAWGANNAGQSTVPNFYYAATAIAAGGNHSLAVINGFAYGWGQNTYGQAGTNGPGIETVAAGPDYSLAMGGGTLIGWGNRLYNPAATPPVISGVLSMTAGNTHGLLLRNNRTVVGWGDNSFGQANPPSGLTNIYAVSAGYYHSLALRVDPVVITSQPQPQTVALHGTATFSVSAKGSPPVLYQWIKDGGAILGATTPTFTINDVQEAYAGLYSVYVFSTLGGVESTRVRLTVNVPPSITAHPQSRETVVGGPVSFSVAATGTAPLAYQWRLNGGNIPGATGTNYVITNAQPSHAGNYTVFVANNYGSVLSDPAVLTVHPLPSIHAQPQNQTVLVGSSVRFSVGASNATLYQWYKNGGRIDGATSAAYSLNSVQTTDAGSFSVGVSNAYGGIMSAAAVLTVNTPSGSSDVTLVAWGQRWVWNGVTYVDLQPPAGLGDITAIATGLRHSLALRPDQTVVGWGDNTYGQAGAPPGVAGVLQIAAGAYHSLARKADGTVMAWGQNDFGQTNVPTDLGSAVSIAAGAYHSLALKNNGTVAGWGKSTWGQTVPPPNVGNANFAALAAGAEHSLALRSNSTVAAWGNNDLNQTSVPFGLTNVMAIASGDNHCLALRGNGTVVAWGHNSNGQTNVPPGLSNVVAIACGANHSLALQRNGRVVAWGSNNNGQTDTTGYYGFMAVAGAGDHCLALKKKALRLLATLDPVRRKCRLFIANEDNSALSMERVSKIDLHATTNANLNPQSWPVVSGIITNGQIYYEEPVTNQAQRFYMTVERP